VSKLSQAKSLQDTMKNIGENLKRTGDNEREDKLKKKEH